LDLHQTIEQIKSTFVEQRQLPMYLSKPKGIENAIGVAILMLFLRSPADATFVHPC
jgi:hypothetical protein